MAEVAGLVAAVIGLAGAGAKLALGLYSISDTIGSSGREIRTVATEISLFSQSLTALSKNLRRKIAETTKIHEIALSLQQSCQSLLDELHAILEDLLPYSLIKNASSKQPLRARMRWVFQKPKVLFLRSSLESFKITLVLLVASIDYAEATSLDAPDAIREPLKDQLETLIIASEDASNDVRFRGEFDCLTKRNEQSADSPLLESPDSDAQALTATASEATANVELSVHDQAITDRESTEGNGDEDIASQLEAASTLQSQHCSLSSQLFHLGSQQLVRQLAKDMIYQRRSHSTWTWEPSQPSADQAMPQNIRNSKLANGSTAVPKAAEPVATPSERENLTNGEFNRTPETRDNRRQGSTDGPPITEEFVPPKTRTDTDRMSRLERTVDQLLDNLHKTAQPHSQGFFSSPGAFNGKDIKPAINDGEDLLRRLGDLVATRQETMAKDTEANDVPPITFKDDRGKKYIFPWDVCCTWKGMEELLKKVMRSYEVDLDYNLIGPNGEIIVPEVWESAVKPDMVITVDMLPLSLTVPPPPLPPPPPLGAPLPASKKSSGKAKKKVGTKSGLKRFVPATLSGDK